MYFLTLNNIQKNYYKSKPKEIKMNGMGINTLTTWIFQGILKL